MHITTVGVSQRARKLSKGRKLVMLLASILIMIVSLLSMDASTPAQAATTGVIFQTTFNTDAIGLYTIAEMKLDFHAPWEDGVTEGLVSVVNNPAGGTGKVLKVHYPVGRTSYGVIIPVPLNAQYDALYLSYDVYFPSDFDFVKEGKLHGLCGGACNSGGAKPNGTDGWSSRVIWRSNGTANQYLYDPRQVGTYGDIFPWNNQQFSRGAWHHVQTYVKMNTPGQHDGISESWLDGSLAYHNNQILFRTVPTLHIDTFKFETFFGGSSSDFAPPKNEYAYFDSIQVSTAPTTTLAH